MEIPDSYIICDTRIGKDFKGITMSGYKRKDVINAFQNSMINGKLEDSIRWCVELHSTGLNNIIWDSLLTIYFKYIHVNNPKFLIYFFKREKDYLNILRKYPKKHEIFTRNNQEIRNLYAELTSILTLTKKNSIFIQKSLPIINGTSFQKDDIHKRMISTNLNKIEDFIFNTTPKEIKFALNEIINNLDKKRGTYQNCIYWYLWIEKYENLKKNNGNGNENGKNNIVLSNKTNEDEEYFDNWVFILWNIILSFENILDKSTKIFLNKLYIFYKKKFRLNQISKKKYIFFIAFYIIKNNIKWNINLLQQEYLIIQSNGNINKMYYNIINNNESSLSEESKKKLHNNYDNLILKILNKTNLKNPKKIMNTNLNDDINKVVFSKYSDYEELKKNNNNNDNWNNDNLNNNVKNKVYDNNLVSTNMTIIDVNNSIEEKKNKKLSAFRDFVTFKKPKINLVKKENNVKTIIDYYNEENNNLNNKGEKLFQNNSNYNNDEDEEYNINDEFNIIKKTIIVNNIFTEGEKKIKSINFTKKK
jgi:hypothetical protein